VKVHLTRLCDVVPSKWRNGAGLTRELVAWPSAQDWIWRMSVADVEHAGPFSRFDGVQRWFAVLSGAGVELQMGQHRYQLTRHSEPLCFAGEQTVDCQLADGATQDFNLMVRRDRVQGFMRRISGEFGVLLNTPKCVAVYALTAGATVRFNQHIDHLQANTLAWQSMSTGASVQVNAADALWIEIEAVA
jgi:environmental stress-induced protein Ves